MADQYSVTSVAHAREMIANARKKMAQMREGAEEVIGEGIRIGEVGAAALGFGYANGRWGENGELAVGGIPVDLGAAVLLHGTAFMGGLGKYAEHGHNLGTGALAAAAYRTGAKIGAAHANKLHGQQAAFPPWHAPAAQFAQPFSPQPQAVQPQAAPPNGVALPQTFATPGYSPG